MGIKLVVFRIFTIVRGYYLRWFKRRLLILEDYLSVYYHTTQISGIQETRWEEANYSTCICTQGTAPLKTKVGGIPYAVRPPLGQRCDHKAVDLYHKSRVYRVYHTHCIQCNTVYWFSKDV
jgi:hypothetical protein